MPQNIPWWTQRGTGYSDFPNISLGLTSRGPTGPPPGSGKTHYQNGWIYDPTTGTWTFDPTATSPITGDPIGGLPPPPTIPDLGEGVAPPPTPTPPIPRPDIPLVPPPAYPSSTIAPGTTPFPTPFPPDYGVPPLRDFQPPIPSNVPAPPTGDLWGGAGSNWFPEPSPTAGPPSTGVPEFPGPTPTGLPSPVEIPQFAPQTIFPDIPNEPPVFAPQTIYPDLPPSEAPPPAPPPPPNPPPAEGMTAPQTEGYFSPYPEEINPPPDETMYPTDLGYFPGDQPPDLSDIAPPDVEIPQPPELPGVTDESQGGGGTAPGVPVAPAQPVFPITWDPRSLYYDPSQNRWNQPTNYQNVGDILSNIGDTFGNLINQPGYSSPAYLTAMGYEPGAGGTMWPGGSPTFAFGGQVNPAAANIPLPGAYVGGGGGSIAGWGKGLGDLQLAHWLQTGAIPQPAVPNPATARMMLAAMRSNPLAPPVTLAQNNWAAWNTPAGREIIAQYLAGGGAGTAPREGQTAVGVRGGGRSPV